MKIDKPYIYIDMPPQILYGGITYLTPKIPEELCFFTNNRLFINIENCYLSVLSKNNNQSGLKNNIRKFVDSILETYNINNINPALYKDVDFLIDNIYFNNLLEGYFN